MNRDEIESIVANCTFKPWKIIVGKLGTDRLYLQVRDENGVNNATGEPNYVWGGRKWLLSKHMTETEIVKTVLKAVLSAVEHETLENFKYKGLTIFDPHITVSDLIELRNNSELDGRA